MLDNLFRSLPRGLLALLAICVGFIFIMLNDPPKSPCEAQLEILKSAQKNFLFKQTKNNIERLPDIDDMADHCRNANSPGGCHELFANLNEMVKDLKSVPASCAEAAGKIDEVEAALVGSLQLLTRIAWGDQPPVSYSMKNGWLDTADVALFCALKERVVTFYGQEKFSEIQERLMKDFPLANTMTRDQIWERTILSNRCDAYR